MLGIRRSSTMSQDFANSERIPRLFSCWSDFQEFSDCCNFGAYGEFQEFTNCENFTNYLSFFRNFRIWRIYRILRVLQIRIILRNSVWRVPTTWTFSKFSKLPIFPKFPRLSKILKCLRVPQFGENNKVKISNCEKFKNSAMCWPISECEAFIEINWRCSRLLRLYDCLPEMSQNVPSFHNSLVSQNFYAPCNSKKTTLNSEFRKHLEILDFRLSEYSYVSDYHSNF